MTGKFKSDGGSSDYYKLEIVRKSDGARFKCEMGDIIYSVYGNDFDIGNAVKALRRIYLDLNGAGKEGADTLYDANKVKYFADQLIQVYQLLQMEEEKPQVMAPVRVDIDKVGAVANGMVQQGSSLKPE